MLAPCCALTHVPAVAAGQGNLFAIAQEKRGVAGITRALRASKERRWDSAYFVAYQRRDSGPAGLLDAGRPSAHLDTTQQQ